MQTKENIPTIELEELPEELKVENCTRNQFFKILYEKFGNKYFQNQYTQAKIFINRDGLRHSVFNNYKHENIPRQIILHLDRILQKSLRVGASTHKNNDPNVKEVHKYEVGTKLYGIEYTIQTVVYEYFNGHTLYDHLVKKKG